MDKQEIYKKAKRFFGGKIPKYVIDIGRDYIILLVKFKGTGEEKGVYITFDDVKNYLYGYYERLEPSKQIEMIKLGSIIPNLYSLFSYIVRG